MNRDETAALNAELLDPHAPTFRAELEALYIALADQLDLQVPQYFIQTSFLRIGGQVVRFTRNQHPIGLGLLFPRRSASAWGHAFTLRIQPFSGETIGEIAAQRTVAALLPNAMLTPLAVQAPIRAASDGYQWQQFTIGAPSHDELQAIQQIQHTVWQVDASAIYPADLYGSDFAPGSALVARHQGAVVAFLLGFISFAALPAGIGAPNARQIESQLMAIDPNWRRFGLAAELKREQARRALSEGISLIHWTADPLQAPNAGLNFGRLRARSATYYVDYYPYRNALSRLPTSRLGIHWALQRAELASRNGNSLPLSQPPEHAVRLNQGEVLNASASAARQLVFELPHDWTALQRDEPAKALAWRQAGDVALGARLGAGGYWITDCCQAEGQRFLLLEARSE